ncbi:MAG TPA: hypothetical protein VKN18_09535 [Blastocatellia bacterium]|nr:hypothetical protein [Blastocatellia bacterium]
MHTITSIRRYSRTALSTDVSFVFLTRHEAANASLAVLARMDNGVLSAVEDFTSWRCFASLRETCVESQSN